MLASGSRDSTSRWRPGDTVVLTVDEFDDLLGALNRRFRVLGPTVVEGAVGLGSVNGVRDLPRGIRDRQSPGSYETYRCDDDLLFAWAVGPASPKGEFLPARQTLWRTQGEGGSVRFVEPNRVAAPIALVGVRPCEVAALGVLDRVLSHGAVPDPRYRERREGTGVVAVECGHPSASCFCSSMGSGPSLEVGADLTMTEVEDPHRLVVRVDTELGSEMLEGVGGRRAEEGDAAARDRVLTAATARISRHLEVQGLAALLARNIEHSRWSEVAERCLSCGNCTMVCPTCFCSDVRDTTDLAGDTSRQRSWSSCFDVDHSFIHGGPVRSSTSSRYRQWMTHKLSTWWDQFNTSGCVGCGRCLTWCPVGIDITEEAAAIRLSDGATSRSRAQGVT